MVNAPLNTLVTYLTGEFENKTQAAESPTWFVHLKLWHALVPALSSVQTYTLFLEQASVVGSKPPYRQRILQLSETQDRQVGQLQGQLRGQYFALSNPAEFIGAATNPQKLAALTQADLVTLPNSEAVIQYQSLNNGYRFQSALPEGKLCSFEYGGQQRYVYLGFEVAPQTNGNIELLTYDKGIDPDTGRGLWGALMGPFRMLKC